ncbi:transposase [Nocardiopsis coralliicola]
MPGFGAVLEAEFIAAAGDLAAHADAGHLASAAGLVPVTRDDQPHRQPAPTRALRRSSSCPRCPRSAPRGPTGSSTSASRVRGSSTSRR